MIPTVFDPKIADLAAARQLDYYTKYCELGSGLKASKVFGVHPAIVCRSLKALEKKAAAIGLIKNHLPEQGVAPGFKIKGTSSLYDKEGNKLLEWVKTKEDMQTLQDRMEEFCAILRDLVPVRAYQIITPAHCIDYLMAVYPLADTHMGLYAWAQETGANFDCDICSDLLHRGVDRLIDSMPAAKTARVENLGDFFHSDTEDATTRRSGNHLDVDGRWGRVLTIGVSVLIYTIDRCLAKHEQVEVVNEIGNHDDYTAYCLSIVLQHHYRNEPRVKIDTTYAKFHYKEFGKVLIGTNHGMVKPQVLHGVMTADMSEAWGRTKFRYWHVGHMHHEWVKEISGVIIEGFRSIKAKDAHEAETGYRAGRALTSILYHKNFGEVERHTCSLDMLMQDGD